MTGLSTPMLSALMLAHSQDGFINKQQLNHQTCWALRSRGLLRPTYGFGWKFGAIFELTKEGQTVMDKQ